jgi:hypothetical protein
MVLEDSGATAPKIENELKTQAGAAKNKANASATTSGTVGTGSAGSATQVDPSGWDWTTVLGAGCLTVALIAVVVYFAFQAFKNYQRNIAYLAAAKGTLGG